MNQQEKDGSQFQPFSMPCCTNSITGGMLKQLKGLDNWEAIRQDCRILEIFISYAHQDQEFRDELEKHLSNLKRQGIISSWSDSDIAPGTEWRRQVMSHLDTAQIILLLISLISWLRISATVSR
jgi:TIR domain